MGKTLRFNSKYDELTKQNRTNKHSDRDSFDEKAKNPKKSKKSKRFLKGYFLRRFWPFTDETKKGKHKIWLLVWKCFGSICLEGG
jgi:hypothetical protein